MVTSSSCRAHHSQGRATHSPGDSSQQTPGGAHSSQCKHSHQQGQAHWEAQQNIKLRHSEEQTAQPRPGEHDDEEAKARR